MESEYRVTIEDVVRAEYVLVAEGRERAEQYALLMHTTESPEAAANEWQVAEREVSVVES